MSIQAIHAIGRDPLGRSDALDRDATGRRLQIAGVGDYALMDWVDEADQHVKVLDIHAADRSLTEPLGGGEPPQEGRPG